ncbi:MAG: hypothetical protein KBH07_06800 [Flavobacteriales bacterium]|nr:hypothetical protein [Flavobacteriales bacterium]MBP9080863.1 hypothetical protein [Flavobacteriales bacterium]
MRLKHLIGSGLCVAALGASGQQVPAFKPTAQGAFVLPLALGNPVFNSLTSTMGQVDGSFNFPLYKGLGVGVGGNVTWYELNGNALAPEVTDGTLNRILFQGRLWWARYTGPRTFYEVNAKLGQGVWDWNCRTCVGNARQSGLHWAVNGAYFLHATDNLAFGLTAGYQEDAAVFGPGVIGLERFPGRTDTGGRYRFFTVGLAFSTGFQSSRERVW